MHEASLHDENCFLTLTFDDDHIPNPPTIAKRDVQLFLKRLRKKIAPKQIRYYACGEYGEKVKMPGSDTLGRPHYHLLIFGWTPPDAVLQYEDEELNIQRFTSELVESAWQKKGFCTSQQLTKETADYVARYAVKKIGGDLAKAHYTYIDPERYSIHQLEPEFGLQSSKPGIGRTWFDRYGESDCAKGYFHHNGVKQSVPKYYKKLLAAAGNKQYAEVVEQRRKAFDVTDDELSPRRLRTKERVREYRSNQLKKRREL